MNEIHIRGDLNLFRVFVAIAEEGSTTAASERLHLSQSAISHALRRLRELLNDRLFVKSGRNLVLTSHGRMILPKVMQSLEVLGECRARVGLFDPLESEIQFNLGFRDIVEYLVLPHLIAPIRLAGSRLQFVSKRVNLDHMEEMLLNGDLDAVVDLVYPASDRITSVEIAKEYLCVMVGLAHPAYDSGTMSMAEYSASYHVLVTLDKRERAYVDQHIIGLGARRHVLLHCEQFFSAARVVSESDLVLTMPYSYAHFLSKSLPVRLLPLPFECEPLPIRLYWRTGADSESYIRWLIERVKKIMGNMPAYTLV